MTDKEKRLAELFGTSMPNKDKAVSETVSSAVKKENAVNESKKTISHVKISHESKENTAKPSTATISKPQTQPEKTATIGRRVINHSETPVNKNKETSSVKQEQKSANVSRPITRSSVNATPQKKPVINTNQKTNSKQVNSVQRPAQPQRNVAFSTEMVDKNDNAYHRIKKKILKQQNENTIAEQIFKEWLNENKTLTLCIVAPDVSNILNEELQCSTIPYAAFKHFRRVTFVIREQDKLRFTNVLGNVKRNMQEESFAWSYDAFQSYAGQQDLHTTAINNLSEVEMEFLRRDITERGNGKQYAMYRTHNGRWSLAFLSKDLATDTSNGKGGLSVLESALYMSIILSGPDGFTLRQRLEDDIQADRSSSTYFNIALQDNDSVYVYDPSVKPKKVMKIDKEGYKRMSVVKKDGMFSLKQGKNFDLHTTIGIRAFLKDLIEMAHKKTTFSMREILSFATNWPAKRKEEKRLKEAVSAAKNIAKIIYEHFVMENKKEDWMKDPNKAMLKVSNFKAFTKTALEAIQKGRAPSGFDEKSINLLMECIEKCSIDKDTLSNVIYSLDAKDFDRPGNSKITEKFISLEDTLMQYEREKETSSGDAFVR